MTHCFEVEIAKKYGVHAAVLLSNIEHWVAHNMANGLHFHDGCFWTYNSKKAFTQLFPYMTARQIDYALKSLIDDEVIKTGNFNTDSRDRTLWYTITKKGYCILQNCEMEQTNLSNVDDIYYITNFTYTDINTDINTDLTKSEKFLIDKVTTSEIDTYFEETYKLFPRKGNKIQAKTTYTKKLQGMEKEEAHKQAQAIYQLLVRVTEQWKDEGKDIKYTPYFSSWLNANVPDAPKKKK